MLCNTERMTGEGSGRKLETTALVSPKKKCFRCSYGNWDTDIQREDENHTLDRSSHSGMTLELFGDAPLPMRYHHLRQPYVGGGSFLGDEMS